MICQHRFGTHYDTIPHGNCIDPSRCDCECNGCLRDKKPCVSCIERQHVTPKIVTLCGSTRFYQAFQLANFHETMQGHIVLSVGFYAHAKTEEWSARIHGEIVGVSPEEKEFLDELHLRKIDLCDDVFVLNVGGYIGESTQKEINYAKEQGKVIRYLEVFTECPACLSSKDADGPDDHHTPTCFHKTCYRVSDYQNGDEELDTELCDECMQVSGVVNVS